jgi:Icc-related predicted phosphoesterase
MTTGPARRGEPGAGPARRPALFVADLHGRPDRYRKLFERVAAERPAAVFLGGDLLPHALARQHRAGTRADDFVGDVIAPGFSALRRDLGPLYPAVFAIPGNDDPRAAEPAMQAAEAAGLWHYVHARRVEWGAYVVYGYACVPPTPFRLKDWERYDVSRFVDPGCVPPDEGWRTVEPAEMATGRAAPTIAEELAALAGDDQARAIWLFHTPPYRTVLDRAALDGRFVDHVPVDVHVGSVAVRRFIEARQPLVTLHGHVHEAARLTGAWRTRIGRTHAFSAAHDGPELAIVRFDPADLERAERVLV